MRANLNFVLVVANPHSSVWSWGLFVRGFGIYGTIKPFAEPQAFCYVLLEFCTPSSAELLAPEKGSQILGAVSLI